MTKDDLITLGLTEEMAQKTIGYFASILKEFIPKSRFKEVNEAKKDFEQRLKECIGRMESLQEKLRSDEISDITIRNLQSDNEAMEAQLNAKIREMGIKLAIRTKLSGSKYPDLLVEEFDMNKLTVNEDGTVTGIDEQVVILQEKYADLFFPKTCDCTPIHQVNFQSRGTAWLPRQGKGAFYRFQNRKGETVGYIIMKRRVKGTYDNRNKASYRQ